MPTGIYKRTKPVWNKGKKGFRHSEETRNKMSKAHKGHQVSRETRRKISKFHKGKPTWNKGGIMSEKQKKEISRTLKGRPRPDLSGEKSHFWRGGITPLIRQIRNCFKYRQWRSDVFERDNYTCQICEKRGEVLNSHHIKSFKIILEEYKIKTLEQVNNCEELWNINNGRTLCEKCHRKTDNYGEGAKIKNNTTK